MYTRLDVINQLKNAGAPRDRVVMLHSAYSRVGDFVGGPREFLDTLIEYFTSEGGLFCVPTHTWGLIGKTEITLDHNDKYTNLGLLPRLALEREDGVRSDNPTHSTVVFGERERALEFICNESESRTPTSPLGCYGKLYRDGGAVLLLGVTHRSNTYLHSVDELLGVEYRLEKKPSKYTVRYRDGKEISREIFMFDESDGDVSLKFDKYSPVFDKCGVQLHTRICDANSLLCDAVGMKNTVEHIYKSLGGRDPLADGVELDSEIIAGNYSIR